MNEVLNKKIPYVDLSSQYKKEREDLLPIIDKFFVIILGKS